MTDRRRFLRRSSLAAGALVLPQLRIPAFGDGPGDRSLVPRAALPEESYALPMEEVDSHQLIVQVWRLLAANELLGGPLSVEDTHALGGVLSRMNGVGHPGLPERIQGLLDPSCLAHVHVNPEARVKVARGPALPVLLEGTWQPFLLKVRNEAGTTSALRTATSPLPSRRWLDVRMFDDAPMLPTLSGFVMEYRIVRLLSHETGRRETSLSFDVGQGTQDLGFRNEVPILFDCRSNR